MSPSHHHHHHHHQDASPPASSRRPLLSSMYAEYLPRLGRLSIAVHLPTPSTQATKALISNGNDDNNDDASRLLVTHDGMTSELALPFDKTAQRGGESLLGVIPPGLHKLTWGLRTCPPDFGDEAAVDASLSVVPWSAADIRAGVAVSCRRCQAVVVERDRLQVWKDLPSENWAEMMEFWHCHKPTTNGHKTGRGKEGQKEQDDKASEKALASRGYGANSAIVAQLGVGFVDLTTMLFHPEDSRCAFKVSRHVAVFLHQGIKKATGRSFSMPWLPIQMPERKTRNSTRLASSTLDEPPRNWTNPRLLKMTKRIVCFEVERVRA